MKKISIMIASAAVLAAVAVLAPAAEAKSFWQQAGIDIGNGWKHATDGAASAGQGLGRLAYCFVNNMCMKVTPDKEDGAIDYIKLSDTGGCAVATNTNGRAIEFAYGPYVVDLAPGESKTIMGLNGQCLALTEMVISAHYI